jgi:hypothetical protein
VYLDITGKIKFATANQSNGLGSGKNDYAMQIDGEKSFGATFITAGLGHKWLGDPNSNVMQRLWYSAAGIGHKITADTTLGASYNYTAAAQAGGAVAREAVAYISHRIDRNLRLNGNLIKGLSNGSADWGVGLSLGYSF